MITIEDIKKMTKNENTTKPYEINWKSLLDLKFFNGDRVIPTRVFNITERYGINTYEMASFLGSEETTFTNGQYYFVKDNKQQYLK